MPSDIEIRRNHIAKPLTWKAGEPGYEGKAWAVKNLLELKNARRVVIEGNLLEGNWPQAQNGFAVLFTVRNQDGAAPWSTVEDVTFANNIVRRTASGINILGRDDVRPSQVARRITIRNNVFEDVGGQRWGGGGTLFQILNGPSQVVIENNTALQTGSIILAEGPPQDGFVFRRNIVPHNAYGIIGTGTSPGTGTVEKYFPGAVIEGNVIAGGESSRYPRGNHFPARSSRCASRISPGATTGWPMAAATARARGRTRASMSMRSSPPARSTRRTRSPLSVAALGQFASPCFVTSALAALNVHPRTPRAARALAPRLARNLPQCKRPN